MIFDQAQAARKAPGSPSSRPKAVLPLMAALALLFLAAAACGSSGPQLPGLGDEVTLAPGASIEIDTGGEFARIWFLSVTSDSRCPAGVQCVAAGEAEILEALSLQDGRRAFPVKIPPGAMVRSEVAGWVLTTVRLLPDPPPQGADEGIYRVTLTLTRP